MEYHEKTVAANVNNTATPASDNSDLNKEIGKDMVTKDFTLLPDQS